MLLVNISIFSLLQLFGLSEKQTLFLLAMLVAFVVFLIIALLFVFLPNRKNNALSKQAKKADFNVRYYTYDYASQTLYSFDKKDISHTKEETIEQFLNQFSGMSENEVKQWLTNIINNDEKQPYLQANVRLSSSKKMVTTMLEFASLDAPKQKIHFLSRMLPFISPMEEPSFKKKKNIKAIHAPKKFVLKDEESAERFLVDKANDRIGAVFYVTLYSKETLLSDEDYARLAEVNETIKPAIYSFLNRYTKMLTLSKTDELIISVSALSKALAINMAMSLAQKIQQELNSSENDSRYFIAIGVTTGAESEKNYKLAKDQAKKMAEAITAGLAKDVRVLFYDEAFFLNYKQTKAQKDEVRMLVKNGTFRLYFTPTLDINTKKQSLYTLSIVPYGTSVSDFSEVCRLASDMNLKGEGKGKEDGLALLLATLAKKIEARGEGKEAKIALKVPYRFLDAFEKALKTIENPNLHFVYALQESDLIHCGDDPNTIFTRLKGIKDRGGEIGLLIDNPSSLLRNKILLTASYFFVPPAFILKKKRLDDMEKSKSDLRNILATYGKFKAPLVYYNLEDYDDVELGIYYGGSIFECNSLGMASSQLEILPKEQIEDLLEDTSNLLSKSALEIKRNEYIDERDPVYENVGAI